MATPKKRVALACAGLAVSSALVAAAAHAQDVSFDKAATLLIATVNGPTEAKEPTFATTDFPAALGTIAAHIGPEGEIVGRCCLEPSCIQGITGSRHGFLLSDDEFTSIDFPVAFSTRAYGLTPGGQVIVGDYCTTPGCIRPTTRSWHGFGLRDSEFTFFDVPFPGVSRL